jgi:hypothetical protein
MFKRLFWMGVGASVGFGTSWWVSRTVKQKLQRFMPARLSTTVAATAQSITGGVKAAVADGREAMHEREAELRAELEARFVPRTSPTAPAAGTPTDRQ